jgi:predicted DNA-binding transcriptional regulator AlpA
VPLTLHGHKDATTDPILVETWWRQYPDALIGVPTGARIGAWVLDPDLDPDKRLDGLEDLARLQGQFGLLPLTVEAKTPRGGRHFYFRWDAAQSITNRSGQLPASINVRGEGGYVIVAPSKREDGAGYTWTNPPELFTPVEAPYWLLKLIGTRAERTPPSSGVQTMPEVSDRLLRLGEVKKLVGLSTSTIERQYRKGAFPKPVKVTHWTNGWRASEIEAWIASRKHVA